MKCWRTGDSTIAVLFLPDRVETWVANNPGATTAGFTLHDSVDNPLGVVPVVPMVNTERLLVPATIPLSVNDPWLEGHSEIEDLIPLCDGLNKLLGDLMVGSEYGARSRRWASGIELVERHVIDEATGEPVLDGDGQPVIEAVNPFPESNRMMLATST